MPDNTIYDLFPENKFKTVIDFFKNSSGTEFIKNGITKPEDVNVLNYEELKLEINSYKLKKNLWKIFVISTIK